MNNAPVEYELTQIGLTRVCNPFELDYVNNEVITNVTIGFNTTQINFIQITTSLNNVTTRGFRTATMTFATLLFDNTTALLGFFGTNTTTTVTSLGGITV